MPASTRPFDVLFELVNDLNVDIVLELTPLGGGGRVSKNVLLGRGKGLSLVLDAGSTYRYTLMTTTRFSRMTIQVWNDIQCTSSSILSETGLGLPTGLTCKAMDIQH
ncbi:hypothetical protein GGU10DRAFT_128006 [Lentinula aff. detonsa]|uniref:Uncharacterized protein n=1 Tax=Lentinula aff. detonsa TaxID=2804958 RepID=A0AA38KXQ4_9AGAR|nr:hypothetical protein GGU10DRAFT_128006 [Lentinula aff. detonsa]